MDVLKINEVKIDKRKGNSGRKKQDFKILDGIESTPEERYVGFGEFVINKPQLFKFNRLCVKYKKNLGSVGKIPCRQVSSTFRDIIKTIWDEQKINHKLLMELSDDEKDFLSNLISRAGLESKLGLDGFRSKDQDEQYKRFELLKGEVLAGNNNKKILQELKQLVLKFMNDGSISKAEGGQILIELMSIL